MASRHHIIVSLCPVLLGACVMAAVSFAAEPSPTPDPVKAELMRRVEEFVVRSLPEITARKTLEWGDVQTDTSGTRSLRYMYEATVRGLGTVIDNRFYVFDRANRVVGWDQHQTFTFNAAGEMVPVKDLLAHRPSHTPSSDQYALPTPANVAREGKPSSVQASAAEASPTTATRDGRSGRKGEKFTMPFVDDPAVIGSWKSVDYVDEPKSFTPGYRSERYHFISLYLDELVFLPGGKVNCRFLDPPIFRSGGKMERKETRRDGRPWTKGFVTILGVPGQYQLKQFGGATYMIVEWMSGDVTIRHRKPEYYVLKKI